jgi:hypothetical protein
MLLDDGASYSETARTVGANRSWLAVMFPGYGWTHEQGGSYGLMMRNMNKKIGGL